MNWYDNIYEPDDRPLKLPIHIFVEEGKHASCPDVNGDGYYMPGYDVNKNINDAWGVRDVIRTESIILPDYQAWMTKIRKDEFKIYPKLPKTSPYFNDLCIPVESDSFICYKVFDKDNCSEMFLSRGKFFPTTDCFTELYNDQPDYVLIKNSYGVVIDSIPGNSLIYLMEKEKFYDSTFTLSCYKNLEKRGVYVPNNVVYELRPMPKLERFKEYHDSLFAEYFQFPTPYSKKSVKSISNLIGDVEDYIVEDNLNIKENSEPIITNDFTKTLSMVYRYNEGHCFDFSIPLLFLKNVEMPVIYGWIVNKLGFNFNKKVWFYNLQYSSSASRFIDPYFSAGIQFSNHIKPEYIIEGGGKIRVKFKWSPFLMQAGVGFSYNLTTNIEQIKKISTVFEIGVGGF